MKKLALLAMGFVLTACGGGGDSDPAPTKPKAEAPEPTQITIAVDQTIDGQSSKSQSKVLNEGERFYHTFSVIEGYVLSLSKETTCAGELKGSDYIIERVTKNCLVKVSSNPKPIVINVTPDENSTIELEKEAYFYGDKAELTVTANEGYVLESVSGCGVQKQNSTSYITHALQSDCTITASTLPTEKQFSAAQLPNIEVTILSEDTAILDSSLGLLTVDDEQLPPVPEKLNFEHGILALDLKVPDGKTAKVQLTYETQLPADFTYQKLIGEQWQALDTELVKVSDDRFSLELSLTDGGAGDADGVVNGVIKDPGAPASLKYYQLSASSNAGGTVSPNTQSIAHGTKGLIKITPSVGFELAAISGCEGELTGLTYTTAAITSDCAVSATFQLKSFLITASSGEGGSITPEQQNITYGTQAKFTVTADEGQTLQAIQGCNGSLNGNVYTTGVITELCSISASFEPQVFLITTQVSEGGSIAPLSKQLAYLEQTAFTLTPSEGYSLAAVTGCEGTLTDNVFTTGAVTENCQVQANFELNTYTVTATASEGGNATPTTQNVNHGSNAQITLSANEGYSLSSVTGCNGTLNGNMYTTGAVTENCQVQANFELNSYTVTAVAGEGGSATPATQNVNHGSNAQITLTANEGYSLSSVTGCNGTLNGNVFTTGAVTANCQVQANFELNTYTVTATTSEGGSVAPVTQDVNHGSSAQITLTANEGYSLSSVTGCNGTLNGNVFTTGAVTANCQVQANFELNTYTVTATASAGGSVTPVTQDVNHGSNAQITLTANEGYSLSSVTGCNGTLNGNVYTTGAVIANCQVLANFEIQQFQVSQTGFNEYPLFISADGENWLEFRGDIYLPLTSGAEQEVFYIQLDDQRLTLSCSIDSCLVTPYTLLVSYIAQAFSEEQLKQARDLLSDTLGIPADPFQEQVATFNTTHFHNWVVSSSLFNVISTISGDVLDGYVDESAVISLSTIAKLRETEEVTVEIGELPDIEEGESLQVYSIASESSSQQQGETLGYLSDYVMQTEFVDAETQEIVKDIIYLSFNVSQWKGKLNAETHTLSSLFIATPEWLFLPESEKAKIAENLILHPDFADAVSIYQRAVLEKDALQILQYQQLLEQIQLSAPSISDTQRQVIQQSVALQVNNVFSNDSLQSQATPINNMQVEASCESKIEERVLVSGVLLDQLKIGMNRTCDQTQLASRMAVWYAWDETANLTSEQKFWEELNNTQMVSPKNFTTINAASSNINDLEPGVSYTLYKKHPHKFISKPGVYNTARGTSMIIKVVFGARPALGDKFPAKLKKAADKAVAIKNEFEGVLVALEGVLAGYQMLFEIFEVYLADEEKNTTLYINAKKRLADTQKVIGSIKAILGDVAIEDELIDVNLPNMFSQIKAKLSGKPNKKLPNLNQLSVKYALIYTLLKPYEIENSGGKIDVSGKQVYLRGLALRLARYNLEAVSGYGNIGKWNVMDGLLRSIGIASESDRKNIMNLSSVQIGSAFVTKNFLNLGRLVNIKTLGEATTETLKSLASETFHNKDEILKAVIWALVDGFINNASNNIVPTIIKSMGPQKYAQLALSGAELGAFATDLAIKPDYLNFKTKHCEGDEDKTCFEVAAPPLEVLPYLVAVDTPNEKGRESGVYVLDASSSLRSTNEHDKHSWPDDKVDYLAAMPIRNNHESAMLVLSGAAISYELDAFVAPHQFKEFESFISLMESDKRTLDFDWFVYPYKNSEWENVSGTSLPVRSEANSLGGNNYKYIRVDAGEYDCDLENGWFQCKDVFVRAKSSELKNPILTGFVKQQSALNAQQDKEYQTDLNDLAFISFTKATKKAGWLQYAPFISPGIRNVSSHMVLGDAKWETDVDIYVLPDYLKRDSDHRSHLEEFVWQSRLQVNEQAEIIGLNARLVRTTNFNYFGDGSDAAQAYRIDNQLFYPIIQAYNSVTEQVAYIQADPIFLNRGDGASISLNQLPQGFKAKKVYIYDSIFGTYLNNVGGSFVGWLTRRASKYHHWTNSFKRQDRQVERCNLETDSYRVYKVPDCEFAGLPYLVVDLETTAMVPVTVVEELTPLVDSDGDGVGDTLDSFPADNRYAFDSDLDGMADKWEEAHGFNPFNSESINNQGPNDDFDQDGFSNLVEFTKTLELGSEFVGYNPTVKTAKWTSHSKEVALPSSERLSVPLQDWLTLYAEQQSASIHMEVQDDFSNELPSVALSSDKQSITIQIPESWPEQQEQTVRLVLQLNSGEFAVSDKPSSDEPDNTARELVEYLTLKLTKLPLGENWVLGVEFTDTNFAQCVREHVDAQQVTRLADLTMLDCSNRNITDVSELSHMTGLAQLNLSNNQLTTINLDANLALTSANLSGNQFTQETLDYLEVIDWVSELNFDRRTPLPQGELTIQANHTFSISENGKTDIGEPITAQFVFNNMLYQGTDNGKLIVSNYLDKSTTRYLIELDEFERLNTRVSLIHVDDTYLYIGILAQNANGMYQAKLLVFESGESSHPTNMIGNILLDESYSDNRLNFGKGAMLFNEQLIVLLNGRILKFDYINGAFSNLNSTTFNGGTSDICRAGERLYARVNRSLRELGYSDGSLEILKSADSISVLNCYGEYLFTDLGVFNTELEPMNEMQGNRQVAYYEINGEVQNNTAQFSNGQCILQVEAFDISTLDKRSEVLKTFDANTSIQCGRMENKRLYQHGDEFTFDYDLGVTVNSEIMNTGVVGARGYVRKISKVDSSELIASFDRVVHLVDLEAKSLIYVTSLAEENMRESKYIDNIDFNSGRLLLDHSLDKRNSESYLERYSINQLGSFDHVSSQNMGDRHGWSYWCDQNLVIRYQAMANGLSYSAVRIHNQNGERIYSGGARDVYCAGEDIYLFSISSTTKHVDKLTQNADGHYEVVSALDEYLRGYSVLSFDNKILINHLSSQENLIAIEGNGIQPAVMGVDAPLEVDGDFIRAFSNTGEVMAEIPYSLRHRPSKEVILSTGVALLVNLEMYFYPLSLNSESPRVANGFDYPVGNRGLNQDGQAIVFNEQITDELNHAYNKSLVDDNHVRVASNSSGWRNAQDVGSFLGNYGGTLFGGVHAGEDWNTTNDDGEEVFAIGNGVVTHLQSTYQSSYLTGGYTMVIAHTLPDNSQVHSVYTHITSHNQVEGLLSTSTDEFSVQVGDNVTRGQAIGRLASNMTSIPTHLHFELRTIAPGTDLYPNDNGIGYYSHDKAKHTSLNAEQIRVAFNIMQNDEGLIDPSDFIDFNRSGVTGKVTAMSTDVPPVYNQPFTLHLEGENFPDTLAVAVHDANCESLERTMTTAQIRCTPNKSGELFVYVKQQSGGVYLHGAQHLWVNVSGSENNVLGVEFTDANFAQCVREHVDAQQVTRLADLTILDCSNRNITDVSELSYMTGLTQLNLSNNQLTTINLDANLALTSADLRGNTFNPTTLDYLATITWIADLKYSTLPPVTGATGKLNDTGITWCADESTINLDCPVQGYEGQDAEYGRDAQAKAGALQKVGGGNGGFDFTKLDANGNDLPASASEWSCVRDNHTGLIWEVKTTYDGLHSQNDRFIWYDPDDNTNGGHPGYKDTGVEVCYGYDADNEASYCNTSAYIQRVNARGLCGFNKWKLPNVEQLLSIVDYSRDWPSIDINYFPNSQSKDYLSSLTSLFDNTKAVSIQFINGELKVNNKDYAWGSVRLVGIENNERD